MESNDGNLPRLSAQRGFNIGEEGFDSRPRGGYLLESQVTKAYAQQSTLDSTAGTLVQNWT